MGFKTMTELDVIEKFNLKLPEGHCSSCHSDEEDGYPDMCSVFIEEEEINVCCQVSIAYNKVAIP